MKSEGVRILKKTVSPAMAKEWLANMAPNRHLRETVVERYYVGMASGRFPDTASPIKFNGDGRMVDGQHRMAALVKYGKPMEFWIATNLETDAIPEMDCGPSRTVGDVLSIHSATKSKGWGSCQMRASTLILLASYERTQGGTFFKGPNNIPPTRTELLEASVKTKDLDASLEIGALASKAFLSGASIFAAIHYVTRKIAGPAADEFFASLLSGGGPEGTLLPKGSPIAALRSQLIAARMQGKRFTRTEIPYRVLTAWNAWRRGEKLSIIRVPKDSKQGLPEIE